MSHDRPGAPVDGPAEVVPLHSPRGRDGWLGEDSEGRPIPCLQCRPHLQRTEP